MNSSAQHVRKLKRAAGARRRAAFVARGLRCDGKPRVGRKPCGCLFGRCLKCMKKAGGYYTKAEAEAMWRDYSSGMSRCAVERKHGVAHKGLQKIFELRGLKLRPYRFRQARRVNGTFVADPPKTAAEINRLISQLTRVSVLKPLHHEWRLWPMGRREWFIRKVRAHLVKTGKADFAPSESPSANVVPFDYWTPAAREIVERLNIDRDSRHKVASLKPSSQGMIYQGRLYFWAGDVYCYATKPYRGHVLLHHVVYEQHHGPVPDAHIVVHKDGNKNNFNSRNLAAMSMADNARRNQVFRRLKEDPDNPRLKAIAAHVIERSHEGRRAAIARREKATMDFLIKNNNQLNKIAA